MKRAILYVASVLTFLLLASCGGAGVHNQKDMTESLPAVSKSISMETQSEPAHSEDIAIQRAQIVGVWQANNMMAAGYADSYVINEDGTFYFMANQMAYHKTRNMKGTWSLADGTITLHITDKIIEKEFDSKNEGLILPDAYSGKTEKIHLEESETMILPVTKPQADAEVPHYSPTITIAGIKFWNFQNDDLLKKDVMEAFAPFHAAAPPQTMALPGKEYIGTWGIRGLPEFAGNEDDKLTISEIGDETIKFSLSFFRLANIDATATMVDNAIKFEGLDPAGNSIYGTLEFYDSSIQLEILQQSWTYPLPQKLVFNVRE